jgi:hypothetical protein
MSIASSQMPIPARSNRCKAETKLSGDTVCRHHFLSLLDARTLPLVRVTCTECNRSLDFLKPGFLWSALGHGERWRCTRASQSRRGCCCLSFV